MGGLPEKWWQKQGKLSKREKSCESWELLESKQQGKPQSLWEPWERSKPLEPEVQEKPSLQVVR